MRIAVIGYSGSGKSTLAKKLGERYRVPVLHMDTVHWMPGWQERPREEEIRIVGAFLDENKDWIVDGNYSSVHYARRMEEADLILFLRFSRIACLWRAWKRYRRYRGTSRDSMTEGCPERMTPSFAWFLFYTSRTGKYKDRYRELLLRYGEKTVVIRNQRELTAFTARLTEGDTL